MFVSFCNAEPTSSLDRYLARIVYHMASMAWPCAAEHRYFCVQCLTSNSHSAKLWWNSSSWGCGRVEARVEAGEGELAGTAGTADAAAEATGPVVTSTRRSRCRRQLKYSLDTLGSEVLMQDDSSSRVSGRLVVSSTFKRGFTWNGKKHCERAIESALTPL